VVHARSVRLAAVIVLGGAVALATTACGGPMQAGAAAVVQGERTSDRDVQSEVASVVSLVERAGLTQGGVTDSQRAALAKAQISLLVEVAKLQKVADDLGVTVGPDADAEERGILVRSARTSLGPKFTGSDNEAVALADIQTQRASGVAPSVVPVFTHIQALKNAIATNQAAQLHIDLNALDAKSAQKLDDAIQALEQKAAGEIDVKVSPRYGAFDPEKGDIFGATTSWIRPTKDQLAARQQQPQ
jgi:hypothetical protein